MLSIIIIITMFTSCKKEDNVNKEMIKCTVTEANNNFESNIDYNNLKEFNAIIDSSNADKGLVKIRYINTTTDNIRIYVLYNYYSCAGYNIKDITKDTIISLTNGIGMYYIEVVKNNGTTETIIATDTIKVTSIDEFSPFLSSTYPVYWEEEMEVIKVAKELTANIYGVPEKVDIIKMFVVESLIYEAEEGKDYSKWTYFPDIEEIYKAKKGVCTDFATMFVAICRSQNIPCKLITGYAGTRDELHVWAEVYDGNDWQLIDLTLEDAKATYINAIIIEPVYYEVVTVD